MGINIFNVFSEPNNEGYLIPIRDHGAVSGSQFVNDNKMLSGAPREKEILEEFLSGNVPEFLRDFAEVRVTVGDDTITYLVTSDYLCLGSDEDYIRMPMSPLTAQKIANKYDCSLPTRKMVNDIWKAADIKLTPKTIPPDSLMSSTVRYAQHSDLVDGQLGTFDPKSLIAGHKKDVVLTNKLAPNNPRKRVAIYGWFYANGKVIQDLNPSDHDDMYADYSHGVRLIINDVIVNGELMRLQDVFAHPKLSALVSDEGVLKFTKY